MKFISLILCLALLCVAVLFSPNAFPSRDVTAGAGSGQSETIKSPAELCDLLQFLVADNSSLVAGDVPALFNLSSTADVKYESVTIHESGYSNVIADGNSATITREMDMYVAQNATYYHSVGSIAASGEGAGMLCDFDIEIFVDLSRHISLTKINAFRMNGVISLQFSPDILGQWLKIEGEGDLFSVLDVDVDNREGFATIGDSLRRAEESGKFSRRNGVYSLPRDEVRDILGMAGLLELDLQNKDNPVLRASSNDSIANMQVYMDATYRFSNINNTVVSMKEDASILVLTMEEMEDFVNYSVGDTED